MDDDIPQKTKHYLNSISDNAKWLLNIINDILDNSKIESGRIAIEHIPYDLQDVISQCQSAILPKATEKGIALYCYAEQLGDKTLVGDPVRMRQVFMNLLSNAVKFTDVGTVKLLASIKDRNDTHATINFEVKDSGIGMSPEQISNIFEPYMQGDDSVTRKFGGTGLGLTITRNIIELMGGQLHVDSQVGTGSTFSFDVTFDLIDSRSSSLPEVIAQKSIERPGFSGEVLVCEDNGLNQQVICEHLARVGLKTVVAANGKEGVEIVKKRSDNNETPFDLIFMDIHMPVMDGLEAARIISEMGIKTPIITLTANIMSNDLELYKASGMVDYLGKPFTSQELWRCLLRYLPVVEYVEVSAQVQSTEEDNSMRQLRIYFAKSNRDIVEKISQAMDDGDVKLAHRLAHTLKGNAGQIGEVYLREISSDIEGMLRNENIPAARTKMWQLEASLAKVLDKLAPLVAEEEEKKIDEISDTRQIRRILAAVEPMLKEMNPESMNMLDSIRSIPGSENLALHVEDFDFKRALKELENLKKNFS